jgi:Phage integrase, N-terminal SAM-like domain
MAATTPSNSLVPVQPVFTDAERLALAGFLAGYRGLTREVYTLDLRQFTGWCRARSLPLFSVRRADIETFARELEGRGRARATVTRRLCTIAGFYKYAVEEEHLEHSPAAHVRRPRLGYESMRPPWTATNSARSWSAQVSDHPASTRSSPCSPSTGCGCQRPPAPTSSTSATSAATAPFHHAQGRQGRHHPARPAHRPGDRPGDRRAHRRPAVRRRGRAAAGPARRRPDRPPDHPPRRHRQARQHAHAAARVHHRRPRRRGATARRPGGRVPRRPAHHHALRPRTYQPGPGRDLHRRCFHRRGQPDNPPDRICLAALGGQADPSPGRDC